jgi:mono/diheme cytochrome c family protein
MQSPAHGSTPARLLLLTAAIGATTAAAQDPLRGRDIYLNAALVKQQPGMRSCVQCHGLPPDRKLWGAARRNCRGPSLP